MHIDRSVRKFAFVIALAMVPITASAQSDGAVDRPDSVFRRTDDIYRQSFSEIHRETMEDVRGRQEWFRIQRSFPYDVIPEGLRQMALRRLAQMEAQTARSRTGKDGVSLLAQNRWESIGPANKAGRVRGVAIDPVNLGTVYIAAAAGGVWKTTDNGTSWKTTTDTLSSLAAGAVAVDPTNPNVVYFGSGENTSNIDRYDGDGIFRSTNGGTTWQNIGLNSVGAISKIHIRADAPRTIYVAAAQSGGGFYRSTDNGGNWTRLASGTFYDMTVNPSNQQQIFLGGQNTIRRSDNGGESFGSAQTGMNLSGALRVSVAIAPSQPSTVYALVARNSTSGGNHVGDVYRSTDAGASWTLTKTLPTNFFNLQGWYDNCIAVDPGDENTVLVGGIDIYRSVDGGLNFTNTTRSYQGGVAHPDQHIVVFDPNTPGLVYLGNDGGVFASLDGGGSWVDVSTKMATSQYYAMDVDQTRPYRVYGGTQDNGSHGSYGTSGFVDDWATVLGGDGFFVVVDLSNPDIIYAENFNGSPMYRINASNTNSRTRIDGSISSANDDGFWVTPIAMSAADNKSLFTGRTYLWRSTNQGGSWEKLTAGNSTGSAGKITTIGLSPHDVGKMMVGTAGGTAHFSTDGGQTWARSTGVPTRFVTDIRYDPVTPGRVYLTVSGSGGGHAYRSDDNGATFGNISANLPDIPTNAVEVDPANNTHVFVGTDVGVFVSLDAGGYWFPYNAGLALSPVVSLKVHRSSRRLVAATHGRSMFRVSIDNIAPVPALISPIGGESYTTPLSLGVRWAGFDGPASISLSYDGGTTWNELATGISGTTGSIDVSLVRTSMARVRVTSSDGSVRLESGNFALNATSNTSSLPRALKAEAIAVRGREMWATSTTSDSIYRLNLPLLTNVRAVARSGVNGHIRSMTYDERRDVFYALIANDDFTGARLAVLDTTGTQVGEIPVPEASLMAVSMDPEGIALASSAPATTVYVIDTAGSVLQTYGPLENGGTDLRRGLQWDLFGYVQGTTRAISPPFFASELQNLGRGNPLRVRENSLVVPQASQELYWVDLAADLSDTAVDNRVIWATDTTGQFYRFSRGVFFTSGINGTPPSFQASGLRLVAVTPNPSHGNGMVTVQYDGKSNLVLSLVDPSGRRVSKLFEGGGEAGDFTVRFTLPDVPSGLYFISADASDGRRDVMPLAIVR